MQLWRSDNNLLVIPEHHAKIEHVFHDDSSAVVENATPCISCSILHAGCFQQHHGLLLKLSIRSACSFDGFDVSRQSSDVARLARTRPSTCILSRYHRLGIVQCNSLLDGCHSTLPRPQLLRIGFHQGQTNRNSCSNRRAPAVARSISFDWRRMVPYVAVKNMERARASLPYVHD